MKRKVNWEEEGIDTPDFEKPDRFGGPPKIPEDAKVVVPYPVNRMSTKSLRKPPKVHKFKNNMCIVTYCL